MVPTRKLLSIAHSYVVALNRRLAHEMARAGKGAWEVTAATPAVFHGDIAGLPIPLEKVCHEECRVVPLPAHCTRFIHFFTYGRRLRSLLQENWDMVHCWEEPYILVGGQVAWWTPRHTPLVFRTAQSINKHYPVPFNWIERYAMRRAAGWICSGQTVADALGARAGYADRPMAQIPLGFDPETHYPDAIAGKAVLRALGWASNGPPVVGYLGRFVPEKGLALLMRALDRLTTPWRALFVGGGKLESALRSWAARHGDHVRICTGVKHEAVPGYLNAMDILTAPSQTTRRWREQFGRMLIEAFACGIPVVGSDSGEIPYLVHDVGEVVGEKDEPGWTRTLEGLLANPARRRELGRRGLERARTRYTWPIVAGQYLDFFQQVIERRQHAPSARQAVYAAL